eukprot:1161299-Pelagomonas_calceolata.AAC.13
MGSAMKSTAMPHSLAENQCWNLDWEVRKVRSAAMPGRRQRKAAPASPLKWVLPATRHGMRTLALE